MYYLINSKGFYYDFSTYVHSVFWSYPPFIWFRVIYMLVSSTSITRSSIFTPLIYDSLLLGYWYIIIYIYVYIYIISLCSEDIGLHVANYWIALCITIDVYNYSKYVR
jgi:hypothetical protein